MDSQNSNNNTKSQKIIKVLIVLLILSLLGLLARYIYLNKFQDSVKVTVPDNIINEIDKIADKGSDEGNSNHSSDLTNSNNSSNKDKNNQNKDKDKNSDSDKDNNNTNDNNNSSDDNPSDKDDNDKDDNDNDSDKVEAPKIELDKKNPGDNERFDVSNMLPGDQVTRYFCVKTYHTYNVKVYFQSNVVEQTNQLGDVLQIKVTDVTKGAANGKIVAQGTFNEINQKSYPVQLKQNENDSTTQYYKIDVSLDTSVGNQYQASKLSADFKWYVTDEEYKGMANKKPAIPGIKDPSDDKGQTRTGDIFDKTLWAIFIGSAIMLIILAVTGRRKKEDK